MKNKATIFFLLLAAIVAVGCHNEGVRSARVEYVMFSDTLSVHPVLQDKESFDIPVVSTVALGYDRTFAVEIVDKDSDAVENRDFRLRSNTVTIKAGETVGNIEVLPVYEMFNDKDTLSFNLRLLASDDVKWDLYGDMTKVSMYKVCPFNLDAFTGYCVATSLFLYKYSAKSYQRIIKTVKSQEKENTIIMKDWLADGYDVSLTFDPSDPANPAVSVEADQVLSDEMSIFGKVNGDNRILVTSSAYHVSSFNSCQNMVYLWAHIYVKNMSETVGTVGYFYHLMEWISDEEAESLKNENGM